MTDADDADDTENGASAADGAGVDDVAGAEDAPRRPRRPRLLVAGVVVALAVVIALTIVLSQDDPEPSRQASAPTSAPANNPDAARPGGAAGEMVSLLESGARHAYEVRYTVTGTGPLGTVRVWSRPPFRRIDTELGEGAGLRRTAQFALPTGTVACERSVEGAWSCVVRPGLPVGWGIVPESFVSQVSRFSVVARSERVGDRDARCFTVTGREGPPSDVCISSDGIPLRLDAGAIKAELTELLTSEPPEEIFELPGPLLQQAPDTTAPS